MVMEMLDMATMLLRIAGLWPRPTDTLWYKCYVICWNAVLCIYLVLQVLDVVSDTEAGLITLMEKINICAYNSVAIYKMFTMNWYLRDIQKIVDLMRTKRFHFENVVTVLTDGKAQIATIAFLIFVFFILNISYIPFFARELWGYAFGDRSAGHVVQLPYFCWVPFDHSANEGLFLLTGLIQYVSFVCIIQTVVSSEIFCYYTMAFIATQCAQLKTTLVAVKPNAERVLATRPHSTLDVEMRTCLVDCIDHHQQILVIATEWERINTVVLMGSVFPLTIMACCLLYIIGVMSIENQIDVRYIFFYMALLIDLFTLTFFGDDILSESDGISNAVYSLEWYGASAEFKKLVIFMSMATSKPIVFTVGKIMPLTLNAYLSIIRVSYSVFTLLQTVEE